MAFLCLVFTFSFSQNDTYVFGQLKTNEYMEYLKSYDPDIRDEIKTIELQIQEFKKKGKFEERILPVIFHIVQTPDMTKITEELINSQISALNRDFSSLEIIEKHPNDPEGMYKERAAIPQIEFCIPTFDEFGKPTDGISTIEIGTQAESFFNSIKDSDKNGISPWNPKKYINVWVTDLAGIESGYAQMPGGDSKTDGIVIDYDFFGLMDSDKNPYNQGKTLTHLMGNYLGLYSLWGKTECGDDYVDDTPIHNDPNFGEPEFQHISLCEDNELEMTMNFMDATYDEGKFMFTEGQVMRLQAILSENGFRSELSKTELECSEKKGLANRNFAEQNIELKNIEIAIHPNPAKDNIYINFKNIGEQDYILYQIVRLNGEIIKRGEMRDLSTTQFLSTQNWESGGYLLVMTYDSKTITQKLIIE